MAISYTIDRARRRIVTHCPSDTVLRDVLLHFDELEQDPDCPDNADVLLDLSEMTAAPNIGQIRAAAERTGDAGRKLGFGSCAVVVSNPALFGMARVFETLTERVFERTAVFRSREAADAWLDAPGAH